MKLHDLIAESVQNIIANPLRSTLSVIGVVFGVASIVAMVGIGVGAEREIDRLISALGARNLHIMPVTPGETSVRKVLALSYGLSQRDVALVQRQFPRSQVSRVSERVAKRINRPQNSAKISILGVDSSFIEIAGASLARGRWFSPAEETLGQPLTVLGYRLAEEMFTEPLKAVGQWVRVDGVWLKIIGVLAEKVVESDGASRPSTTVSDGEGQQLSGVGFNDAFVIPFSTGELRLGPLPVMERFERILVRVDERTSPLEAKMMLQVSLDQLHHGADVFRVAAAEEVIAQKKQASRLFSYFLLTIATISLIVGGIGIANVMLAAVVERIREIGLRRALGARKRDILRQFLAESTAICVAGGLIGNLLGFGVAFGAGAFTGWSVALPWWSILISIGLAVLVGIGAGMYPAFAASKTSPIEALQGRA